MNEVEFVERFITHCRKACGFTHFHDGEPVEAYAAMVALLYWADPDQRDEGPEACADADMSYWGED